VGFRDFAGEGSALGSNGRDRRVPSDQGALVHRTTVLATLAAALVLTSAAIATTVPGATIARAEVGPYTTPHTGVVVDAGVTAHGSPAETSSSSGDLRRAAAHQSVRGRAVPTWFRGGRGRGLGRRTAGHVIDGRPSGAPRLLPAHRRRRPLPPCLGGVLPGG